MMNMIEATEIATAACPTIHIQARKTIGVCRAPYDKRLWMRDSDVRCYEVSFCLQAETCARLWALTEGTTLVVHILEESRWIRLENAIPIEQGMNIGHQGENEVTIECVRFGPPFPFFDLKMWL